ncbi:putative methyltransferase NSUN7 isoform X2 [Arvicanthis niloticus]|uniref:putative methyltransferase NSUN7 isoform X2 n=1 Tax=Arvicanthis niloticus TaxID=61156 RepID=UPI0014862099|nr:putative methyltransferase NSUN7 isoform X2 [Arvicanthis niloticus]
MQEPKSDMDFFGEENMEGISQLASLEMSGDVVDKGKSSIVLEKPSYPDSVYVMAANIFQGIRIQRSPDKVIINYGSEPLQTSSTHSEDESFQRLSYELAFSTLKYQDILESILIDSYIFSSTTIADRLNSLIVVMLYDFQDRKFQPRVLPNDEETIAEVQEVETLLNSFKTKLAAALARCRIKHDALSIYHILPETVRKQEQRASTLPLYAWINTSKISLEEVYGNLRRKGYAKVKTVTNLNDKAFAIDQHCYNVLIFPAHLKTDLLNIDLIKEYKLIFQDKSRSLAVHSAKALINMDDDILMINTGSWYTVAHMSILTSGNTSKIFVCGIQSEEKDSDAKKLFTKMGCENIEILNETFLSTESRDHRLQNVKVILLLPHCSSLGVSNPVEFILNEHQDTSLLHDLSQGGLPKDKLEIFSQQQFEQLTHAMKFTKAQAIIYCTCSVSEEENEDVIKKALACQNPGPKIQPYRLSPPVLPLCSLKEIELSMDRFFRLEPSDMTNGCFLSILTRERDPSETVSVKDVLARAAAKGLLDGVEVGKAIKRDKKRKKPKALPPRAPHHGDPLRDHLVVSGNDTSSSIQMKISEFLHRESKTSSVVKTPLPTKSVPQASTSSQMRKPSKPLSTPLVRNASRPIEKPTNFGRLRPEGKVIPLKPVEIVLPPVMFPLSPQGPRFQMPATQFYYRFLGSKDSSREDRINKFLIK